MKRFLSIIFFAIFMLSIAVPAFADAGPPVYRSFDVIVTNPIGAIRYETEYKDDDDPTMIIVGKPIPYNTTLSVDGEFVYKNELYLFVFYDENNDGSSSGCYIKRRDVKNVNEFVAYEKDDKLEVARKIILLEDIRLRKGHSPAFDETGEVIKAGTELTVNYMVGEPFYTAWGYVNHNGNEGWLNLKTNEDDCTVAYVINSEDRYTGDLYIVRKGAKLRDKPLEDDVRYLTEDIPVGTNLKIKAYVSKTYKTFVLVEYNGVNGWLECERYEHQGNEYNEVAIGIDDDICVYPEDIKVYSDPSFDNGKEVGTLKKNTVVKTYYHCRIIEEDKSREPKYEDRYYRNDVSIYGVKFNGKLCWIRVKKDEYTFAYPLYAPRGILIKDGNAVMYSYPDGKSEIITTIPEGTDVLWFGEAPKYVLVEYNGKSGWIEESFSSGAYRENSPMFTFEEYYSGKLTSDYIKAIRTNGSVEETQPPETTVTEAETTAEAETTQETETVTQTQVAVDGYSPKQIAGFCIAAALVVAATSAVSIVLIKKKRSNS